MKNFVFIIFQNGGVNISNRKYDKSKYRALSDYYLHKFILKNYPKKYSYLSKKYLRSIIYAQQNAKLSGIKWNELLSGLKLREKLTIILVSIPLAILKK